LEYVPPPVANTLENHLKESISQQNAAHRQWYYLAVCLKNTQTIIGDAVLQGIDLHNKSGELGWGLDPAFWGQGFGTEIGEALIRFGFMVLDLHRIFALCSVENVASIRVMEKIGMKTEGIIREHFFARNKWWTSHQSSILRHEFIP
jgi:RimJ/RimL family protein N-acetyltransferase